MSLNGPGIQKFLFEAESVENSQAAPADKFPANAMAGKMSRFKDCHRNFPFSQGDAESQPGEAAANDSDGSGCRHFTIVGR